MNGREKSDLAIVAEKSTNEAERPGSEPMEPRVGAEGKGIQQSAHMRFRGMTAGRSAFLSPLRRRRFRLTAAVCNDDSGAKDEARA